MTEVERGFEEYFASRKVPVHITWRDLNRDPSRMPGFLDEIRQSKPDLIYTWGTSVTLGVVGAHDAADRTPYINNIPVVFTLVAAPVLAKIVDHLASSGRNVTGVTHAARQLPGHAGRGRDHSGGDGAFAAHLRVDRAAVQAGALTGLVSRYFSLGQYTAHKVEQILVGKQAPASIPVDTLKRFSYQISMSAAKRLKLPPPMNMLNFAELINTGTPGT